MAKTERLEIRLPIETREILNETSSKNNITRAEFIRQAIAEKAYRSSPEYQTEQTILINKIMNILNAYPNLDKNFKKTITKELYGYGKHSH